MSHRYRFLQLLRSKKSCKEVVFFFQLAIFSLVKCSPKSKAVLVVSSRSCYHSLWVEANGAITRGSSEAHLIQLIGQMSSCTGNTEFELLIDDDAKGASFHVPDAGTVALVVGKLKEATSPVMPVKYCRQS